MAGIELKGSWSRFGRVVVLERGRRMPNWRFLEGMAQVLVNLISYDREHSVEND